jgi:hypothetical protein
MKKQVSNYRSYNIVISTLVLIGILFIGLVGNIYNQEAAAQSFNLNLPNIKADIPAAVVGTGKIPIQIGNIISAIQTGILGPVQKMDGGSTWTYIDPFRDMHDFCCDQDVVYDPNHQIFISYNSNNTNTNSSSSSTTQLQSTWKMQPAMHGTNGPSHNDWGDYLRVRPYSGSNLNWIASGYTLQGGSTEDFIQPLYLVFGPQINATNMNSSVP